MLRVYVRHSHATNSKPRPPWFSKLACLRSLLDTVDAGTQVTFLFDGASVAGHFLAEEAIPAPHRVVCLQGGGTDAASFLNALRHVAAAALPPDDIVCFLEDDYLCLPGWCQAVREGLGVADYVSCYDHPDKYDARMYPALTARLTATPSAHWRSAPSTTNSYAMTAGTLARDMVVHENFCWLHMGHTADNEKFQCLTGQCGRTLATCVPAFWTHCEVGMLSPCRDWDWGAPGKKC